MFITFEGGEGCGKSTQSHILYDSLINAEYKCLLTHEPGGTEISEEICKILKSNHNEQINSMTELLLFNASRAQLVEQIIKPELANNTIVICDRYTDSTLAYQGYGRGLDFKIINEANDLGCNGLVPDVTFFLDMNPEDSFKRIKESLDRIEQESLDFHEKVLNGFREIAHNNPKRIIRIDASLSINEISDIIWNKVISLLNE